MRWVFGTRHPVRRRSIISPSIIRSSRSLSASASAPPALIIGVYALGAITGNGLFALLRLSVEEPAVRA